MLVVTPITTDLTYLLMIKNSRDVEKVSQQLAKPFYDAKVQPSTLIPKQVGNMYTASLYAAFASLIHNKYSELLRYDPSDELFGLGVEFKAKNLNAKTGLFSKRMKIIHRDPKLHAQRVAAIKKAKGTAAARNHASETLKAFFSDQQNRRQWSIAMKGVRFFCQHCGRDGHRKFYCPELKDSLIDKGFKCRLCGGKRP